MREKELREFIDSFDFKNFDFNKLPDGFFDGDLSSLTSAEIGKYMAMSRSEYRRKSQLDDALRSVVANIEEGFARATTKQYLDFLGFSQGSLKEVKGDFQRAWQDGLLDSRPGSSLVEMGVDLKEWHEVLKKSVISRKVLQNPLKSLKGNYRSLGEFRGKPFEFGYLAVDNLKAQNLTYEIFIELVNKTDWHLRRLVESLETKLNKEQKFYQVEKARIS